MSDVEKILHENHERRTACVNVEKRRKDREDRECRRLNRHISRLGYWFSGITTVLGCVAFLSEAWAAGALLTVATILLVLCGRVLED